jgi:hypothetical protein
MAGEGLLKHLQQSRGGNETRHEGDKFRGIPELERAQARYYYCLADFLTCEIDVDQQLARARKIVKARRGPHFDCGDTVGSLRRRRQSQEASQ